MVLAAPLEGGLEAASFAETVGTSGKGLGVVSAWFKLEEGGLVTGSTDGSLLGALGVTIGL